VAVLAPQDQRARKKDKGEMIDEFVRLAGYFS